MSRAQAKLLGDRLETDTISRHDELEVVPDVEDDRYDARTTELFVGGHGVRMLAVVAVESNTPVEIKFASARINCGSRGRWYIKRRAHEWLLANDGVYYLGVYDQETGDTVSNLVVPASVVEAAISSWITASDDRCEQEYAQVTWSVLIDPIQVEPGGESVATDGGSES